MLQRNIRQGEGAWQKIDVTKRRAIKKPLKMEMTCTSHLSLKPTCFYSSQMVRFIRKDWGKMNVLEVIFHRIRF